MSAIQKIGYLDPRIDSLNKMKYEKFYTEIGATQISVIQNMASSYSNNSANFTPSFNDNNTSVIDRSSVHFILPVTIDMATTQTSGSGNLYNPSFEGFRACPIETILENLIITVKGKQISYHCNEIIQLSQRYDQYDLSKITPQYGDMSQTYADMNASNLSPFASVYDNPKTRRSQPITVVSNTPTAAKLTANLIMNMSCYAPFTTKPYSFGLNMDPATLIYQYQSNLNRIWSRDIVNSTRVLETMTVTLGRPELDFIQLSLPQGVQLPSSIDYDYVNIDQHTITDPVTTRAQYTNFNILSDNFQFDSIFDKMLVCVHVAKSAIDSSVSNSVGITDTYAAINSLSVSIGNRTDILNNYSQAEIYEICRKNGLDKDISYYDFIGLNNGTNLMGSVVALVPADLGTDMVAGVNRKSTFQIKANVTALNPLTLAYEMSVIFIRNGIMTISGNNCELNYIPISNISELRLSEKPYREIAALNGGLNLGDIGRFFNTAFSKVKEYAKPVNQFLKNTRVLSSAASLLPKVGPIAGPIISSLGYGDGGDGGMLAYGDGMRAYGDGGEGSGYLSGGRIIRNAMKRNR